MVRSITRSWPRVSRGPPHGGSEGDPDSVTQCEGDRRRRTWKSNPELLEARGPLRRSVAPLLARSVKPVPSRQGVGAGRRPLKPCGQRTAGDAKAATSFVPHKGPTVLAPPPYPE